MNGLDADFIELGIVGAGEHRLKFNLTLAIAPVMKVSELTEAERRTLERNVESLIRAALEKKVVVRHQGRDRYAEVAQLQAVDHVLAGLEW